MNPKTWWTAAGIALGGGILLAPLMGWSWVDSDRVAIRWTHPLPWGISCVAAALFLASRLAGPRSGADADASSSSDAWVRMFSRPEAAFGLLGALALSAPFLSDRYQQFFFDALLMMLLALGMNIILGMAGLFVLGYAAFYAIGAYSYGILSLVYGLPFWPGVLTGSLLAALVGLAVGLPSLRLRGDYLALATLGLGETIRLVIMNATAWTGGTFGCPGLEFYRGHHLDPAEAVSRQIQPPRIFGWPGEVEPIHFLYVGLAFAAFFTFLSFRLSRSRLGRAWIAIREDELAARAMGVDAVRVKLSAFAIGAAIAGAAGALFAARQGYLHPNTFDFNLSVLVLSVVVIGGMGSVSGCIAGTFGLMALTQFLRDASDGRYQEFRFLAYGAAMVLMMIFRPQGILPDLRHSREVGR